jgi:hypothetical protein
MISALHDQDENIVFQALFSIHQSLNDELDETGIVQFVFSDEMKNRIREELLNREDSFVEFQELTELLELLDDL